MTRKIVVRLVGPEGLASCHAIRREVFIEGQGVPESLEYEGDDEGLHFLAICDGAEVGTARMRVVDGNAKAERVAVLDAEQHSGVGRALMRALEAQARKQRLPIVVLNAQVVVRPFYERLGYTAEGEVFVEADMPHIAMRKWLRGGTPDEVP